MIFVTVGSQLPFDRLIRTVDAWTGVQARDDVIAQKGKSSYVPKHLRAEPFLTPAEFRQHVDRADAVVAHAGIGTILACIEGKKPLLVFPRRAALNEHRNDHQLATVRHLTGRAGIWVALDEQELWSQLMRIESEAPASLKLAAPCRPLIARIQHYASGKL